MEYCGGEAKEEGGHGFLSISQHVLCFRRQLGDRDGAAGSVVYAVPTTYVHGR